jgi:uncharacterized protein (UPF0335 family)
MSSQPLDSSDKSLLLNAFNTQLTEFIEDIELVFSEDSAIKKAKTSIFMIKKVNPTITAKIWYNYICSKYESEINNDNIDFFLEKDYKKDLVYMNQSEQIISSIDKLRHPIKNMSKENQEKSLKYVKNLCILSKLYMQ